MSLVDGPLCREDGVLPAEIQRVLSSRPPPPASLALTPITLLVSEACVSEEGIRIHVEMPDPPPPRLLPPAGNQDTDASTLLAQRRSSPSAPRHLTTPPLA